MINFTMMVIKGLRYREDILDNIGSEELADNLFRLVQTEAKLKRDNIKGENNASETMPENLPTPKKSLKELEKDKKLLK